MRFHRKVSLAATALHAVSALAQIACNNSPSLCDRQYSDITYLGSHNAPFLRDSSTGFSTSGNQYYNTTVQLSAGIRLLSAQVQTPSDSTALHVCHSSCQLLDAGTLSSWLSEIKTWMDSNPNDVVTILLVNGAGASASALAEAYTSSGLAALAFTPIFPMANNNWPTLNELISSGTRAMNFVATLDDNTAAPFLMNEWDYMFENDFQNTTPTDYSCEASRPPSVANAASTAIMSGYMALQNHFLYETQAFGISSPNESYIETTNAPSGGIGNLGTAAATCASAYGRAPNFLLVDFSTVGPAIEVADNLNGITPTGRTTVSAQMLTADSAAASAFQKGLFAWSGLTGALAMFLML